MHYSLEMLIKRQQVVDAVNQLFIQTDQRNWLMVEKCFADRVEMDLTSLAGGETEVLSPQDITARWDENLRDLTALHHQVGNFVVDLHGDDNAHVYCYGTTFHHLRVGDNTQTRTIVGTYDFDLVRSSDDRWRIASFWFDCKFTEGALEPAERLEVVLELAEPG